MFKKLAREDNFLSLMGNVVIAVLGLLGFALLARSLSLDVFGEWVLFITGGSFVEMFRFGITNTGLIRFLSGADQSSRTKLIGSNALIGLCATVLVAFIIALCYQVFHDALAGSAYNLFFKWYPVLAFANLPWNNALVVLQADRRYDRMLLIKSINSGLFFLVILFHFFFVEMALNELVITLLVINGITSGLTIVLGWDGTKLITRAGSETNKTLLNFGKYTTITLIGTNFLVSADAVIISLSPMGSAAVAMYSIPLKLTELLQIPLRSFVATAFPKMSKASIQDNLKQVRYLFYTYSGALTYLFAAMSIFVFVFAEYLVLMLSGEHYLRASPEMGSNVVAIVRVFALYGLLLPIDRMTGVGLDSVNRPKVNAFKVFVMVAANVTGDLIAVFVFESLLLVAVASIAFTLIGIGVGMYFLNKELNLTYGAIFSCGANFYKNNFKKLVHGRYALANK
ncbi:lipopolysaccharide biosynthesis protein [Maribacter sp. 2307ULW6-5]|uniref:lipopolysaccharide biosynthesis protein n=1 Tax=Maribacter sp. 2307ULW6-5 TaxID=3386275 RepID=UPI0039BC3CA7